MPKEFYSGDFVKDYQFFNEQTRLPDNLYVVATKTDPIVFPSDNYEKLAAKRHDNTFFYMFDEGFHCSMAYAYQWKFLDTLFSVMIGSNEVVANEANRKYRLNITKSHPPAHDLISGDLEIRSVEVSKIDTKSVELLVYFHGESLVKSAHVEIPLRDLYLDEHFIGYDIEVIRNYIKRLIQTKFRIEKEADGVFIKI